MSVVISSAINPNSYDPISDLKKQEVRKIPVIVNINNACLVQGGVDTVMKSDRGRAANMESVIENSIEELSISDTGHASQPSPSRSGIGSESPFGFLNDDVSSTSSRSNSTASLRSKSGKFARFGAKLKNQFDRGVTSIAVQAQKATTGDNTEIRDLLTVGAYVQDKETGEFNSCIGMTERLEMPINPAEGDGLTFSVPILIPLDVIQSSAANPGAVVQFYVWMRSGATIFAKNRALRKYVFVGSSTLRLAELAQQVQPKFERPVIMTMPLQSVVVSSGEMTATIISDTKFPSLCGNGWSLSDPRTDTAYSRIPGKRIIFNPPLEQNYSFSLPSQPMTPSPGTILATERVTESTVVLPLAAAWTRLISTASASSASHAMDLVRKLQFLDGVDTINPMTAMQQGHAQCQIDIFHFLKYPNAIDTTTGGGSIQLSLNIQRPDSIFENCIASSCTVPSHPYVQNMKYPLYNPAASIPFYPRIVKKNDPRLLPGQTMGAVGSQRDVFVGKVRIQLYEEGIGGAAGGDLFSPLGPAGAVGTNPRNLEALIDLDSHLNEPDDKGIVYLNVMDLMTGQVAGTLAVGIRAQTLEGMVENSNGINGSTENDIIDGGLISLVGMDTMMEDDKACYPHSDLNSISAAKVLTRPTQNDTIESKRLRQLATMGEFLTCDYMIRHTEETRTKDNKGFLEKAERYLSTLNSPIVEGEAILPPDKQREPRPFRPSSSRMDSLLSAIGFNIHIQSFSISAIVAGTSGDVANIPKALFHNVTCGAPAAHEKGFSQKGSNKEKFFSGGLRRLEESRRAVAGNLRESQDRLIDAVRTYYSTNTQTIPGQSMRHIPTREHKIASLRSACISNTQTLHSLTWEIAARRSTVFSQALGIGVSLFLAHVSDLAKLQKAAWAELWQKHGFLITFEGMLSAAGKELGMIEDASIGIAMLRMVSVVFVTESTQVNPSARDSRVPIKDSPYLMWLRINPSGEGLNARYLIELCVDANYYAQRIPPPLKNQNEIRFYPVLYQMGVDIRQWGANAGANFGKSKNEEKDEMDEDEIGIPDKDVLLALNYEAFRKMNAYAHEVFLCADPQNKIRVTWEEAHSAQQIQQPIHPMLSSLYEFIRSSAGKMEHGILDEAGFTSNRLGGGSAIFCKSGKDRTAMQVTFKQAQFMRRFLISNGNGFSECEVDPKKVFSDATIMRVYGTRLPICDKNVGQSLYAFNALQAKFMPEILKPPSRALAGFLKGGRVFSGGAIES